MFKTALFYDSPKKHQKSVVPKIAAFSAALLLACSCESEGRLPNEKKGKIDLAAFLADKISQYGGSRGIATTNDSRLNDYVYSQDENGFQVLLSGDKVPEVLELFIHSLGQPR